MEAITPTVLPGEPKAPGEGSYMRDQRTGDVPPTGACKDGRYGSKQEARRKKAPKDERLNRHHANSSSDFWENQELHGMRITRKIKGITHEKRGIITRTLSRKAIMPTVPPASRRTESSRRQGSHKGPTNERWITHKKQAQTIDTRATRKSGGERT